MNLKYNQKMSNIIILGKNFNLFFFSFHCLYFFMSVSLSLSLSLSLFLFFSLACTRQPAVHHVPGKILKDFILGARISISFANN